MKISRVVCFGVLVYLLGISIGAAYAQVTKVETVPGPTCWSWGGSSNGQGQFSNCGQTTIITVTETKIEKVNVPVPIVTEKLVTPKKIRE